MLTAPSAAKIFAEALPRVEYAIGDYLRTLQAQLSALAEWIFTEGKTLFDAKARSGAGPFHFEK